jgi:predicted acylesterase/phospholipase RssA
MINYLVLSGGGQTFFSNIGIFDVLDKNNVFQLEDIKSIYSTSAGSIISLLLCLNYEWDDIVDYIIRCPWETKLKIGIDQALSIFENNGIYSDNLFISMFKPLLAGKNLTLDITLKELFDYSNITLHIYTFELNEFEEIDLSHLTHPDLKVLEAIRMSCSIPLIITPICRNGKCYIDGGIKNNYPLNKCLDIEKCDESTVLGIRNNYEDIKPITNGSTINDYIRIFIKQFVRLNSNEDCVKISNEIFIPTKGVSTDLLLDALCNLQTRENMVLEGKNIANEYLEQLQV